MNWKHGVEAPKGREKREKPRNKDPRARLEACSGPLKGSAGAGGEGGAEAFASLSGRRPEDKAPAVPGVPISGNLLPALREVPEPGPGDGHTPSRS